MTVRRGHILSTVRGEHIFLTVRGELCRTMTAPAPFREPQDERRATTVLSGFGMEPSRWTCRGPSSAACSSPPK